jgi:hypothetical protein
MGGHHQRAMKLHKLAPLMVLYIAKSSYCTELLIHGFQSSSDHANCSRRCTYMPAAHTEYAPRLPSSTSTSRHASVRTASLWRGAAIAGRVLPGAPASAAAATAVTAAAATPATAAARPVAVSAAATLLAGTARSRGCAAVVAAAPGGADKVVACTRLACCQAAVLCWRPWQRLGRGRAAGPAPAAAAAAAVAVARRWRGRPVGAMRAVDSMSAAHVQEYTCLQ